MHSDRYDRAFALRAARDMRANADAALGEAREYYLWLAMEWERTADRTGAGVKGLTPGRTASRDSEI